MRNGKPGLRSDCTLWLVFQDSRMKCDPTLTLGRITPRKSALRPKSQGLPAGECRHNGYLLSGAYSRSRLSRRTVSSRVTMVRSEAAATRNVHSMTPVFEWLMPDRIFKHGSAVNPSICDKSGKHQHCQQDAAADCICNDFPLRDWVLSQYRAAALAAVTPNRLLHPLRSPYPRRS